MGTDGWQGVLRDGVRVTMCTCGHGEERQRLLSSVNGNSKVTLWVCTYIGCFLRVSAMELSQGIEDAKNCSCKDFAW